MKTWVKLYTEINRDPKVLTLTWAQRGIYNALLALAGEIDVRDEMGMETGELDTIPYTAIRLRCEMPEFEETLARLTSLNMIEEHEGVLFIHNYAERQRRKPSDSRDAVAARVQRHREQRAAASNANVTPAQRPVTRTDSDADANSDSNSEADAAAPQQQPTEPAPSIYGRHVESAPDVAFLFQQVDRAGVFVNGKTGDDQWRAILDVTRDHGLIQEAFIEAASTSARQPSPKLLRTILERCVAEGCRPGQWPKGASAPPAKRETAYERSGRVLDKYLEGGSDGDVTDSDAGAQIVEGKLADPRDRRGYHPALPSGAG